MDSADLEVLKTTVAWRSEGKKVVLVTVAKTWGSSPRPEGAILAVREDGFVSGSVSGGCIEDDLIRRIRTEGIQATQPELVSYGVSADAARQFGLPCGGTIELVIEPLQDHSAIEDIYGRICAGELFAKHLNFKTGIVSILPGIEHQFSYSKDFLISPFGPRYRVIVIGAGQLSKFFCQIMLGLGFQVTVCDPREEYIDTWDIDGVQITRDMPDDVVIHSKPDARTAIVALTHDPKLDDLALLEALHSSAFYVAALGSRKNNISRRQRLKEHFQMNDVDLAKLHGPAGIFIGSKIPSEIAVSIAAELIAAKNDALSLYPQLGEIKDQIAGHAL